MQLRLGHILVERGILSHSQAQQVCQQQQRTGKPFGLLCEEMFGIDPEQVELAWAQQYARMAQSVDPLTCDIDAHAQNMITRRQAWQFGIVPLRFDGSELMIATSPGHLRRALRFCTAVMGVPVYLVMCTPEQLGAALCRYYALPGLTQNSLLEREVTAAG